MESEKEKKMNEYNKIETDSDTENQLVMTSGEREGRQAQNRGLRDINRYV